MRFHKLFLLLLLFTTANTFAQNAGAWSFNIDLNSNLTNGNLRDNWPIRQDVGASYYDYYFYSSNRVTADMNFSQISIRPEYQLIRDKLSVSTGIRFTHLQSEVSKYDSENGGYFYLRYESNPTSTEYARINSITEETAYLGVPLEFQITPFRFYKLAPYLRIGSEVGFRLSSSNAIKFHTESMEIYADDIMQQYGFVPQSIFATLNSSVGFSLGAAGKINYNFEFLLPSLFLTNRNSSLLDLDGFSGFRFSLRIPLSQLRASK